MNYYEHHIGDFAQATGHLSFIEDAAYSRLIRKYYAEEKPLPAEIKSVQRLVAARTKEERQAVVDVLEEFFYLEADGWHNKRCDSEIARYFDKQTKARASADARWSKRNANAMRPDSATDANASTGNDANAMRPQCEGNAHQTPDTRHQAPDLKSKTGSAHTETIDSVLDAEKIPAPDQPPTSTSGGIACRAMREAGIPDGNPTHPTLIALLDAGATPDEFKGAAFEAVRKGKPSFAYVVGTVKKRREEAAKLVLHHGRMPNKQEAIEAANKAATAGWKPPELRENVA